MFILHLTMQTLDLSNQPTDQINKQTINVNKLMATNFEIRNISKRVELQKKKKRKKLIRIFV